MRTGERTQMIGQREGHQEVGTGEQVCPLFVQPAIRLELVTLRAGAIAAGNGELSITCLMGSVSLWGVRGGIFFVLLREPVF